MSINFETILFLDLLNDLAERTKNGFIRFSDIESDIIRINNFEDVIVYDDKNYRMQGYPIVKHFSTKVENGKIKRKLLSTYDEDYTASGIHYLENLHITAYIDNDAPECNHIEIIDKNTLITIHISNGKWEIPWRRI